MTNDNEWTRYSNPRRCSTIDKNGLLTTFAGIWGASRALRYSNVAEQPVRRILSSDIRAASVHKVVALLTISHVSVPARGGSRSGVS